MTREEAQRKLFGLTYYDENRKLIDKIYDDFESRTCENCRFSGICYILQTVEKETYTIDFGCNKWEVK